MNRRVGWGLVALLALGMVRVAAAASASDMQQLAQSEGCFSCHAIDHKKVGPAYSAIAQRYANNPHAAAILQDAILNGHQGTWGVIPMPAYAPDGYLNPHQALELAKWILSLKPTP